MTKEKHGSQTYYAMLAEMAETHDRKSHDYATNENPVGNYEFAGQLAGMFAHSSQDAGFIGRIGEKIYRLANLESGNKTPKNESIEDTEKDICVITVLWMAARRDKRNKPNKLMHELHDLIRLMPDSQLDELNNYIIGVNSLRGRIPTNQESDHLFLRRAINKELK